MTDQTKPRTSRQWAGAWFGLAAMMVAYSCVILAARMPPPFVDLPDWVYQGVLFHGVLTGHPFAGYALKHYPIPNSTTTVALGLLDSILPWQWAGKVWIVFYLGLSGFVSWVVLRVLAIDDWRAVVAMPGIVFVNLNFWYGHISFEFGVLLVLLLLAMLVRGSSTPWLAAMMTLIFFTHMEACACALLLLGVWCAMTRDWKRMSAALPTVALTVWYMAARFGGGNADARGIPLPDYKYGSGAFLVYKANTFFKTFAYVNARMKSGPSLSEAILGKGVFVALILASLVLAILCLTQISRAVLAAYLDGNSPLPRRVVAWFVAALLLVSVLLPQIWLGVADPGSRLLLMAAAGGLLLIDWRGRSGLGIAILSAIFCLANLFQLARVEQNPEMKGAPRDLPAALLLYGHVELETRLQYYDALQDGKMDAPIFPTALFIRDSK